MAISIATDLKNAMLLQVLAAVGSAATIHIYSGAIPATVNSSLGSAVLLVSFTCPTVFAPNPSNGILTANSINQSTVISSGLASFYRLVASDGSTVLIQGAVGTANTEMILNIVNLVAAGPCIIRSLVIGM